MSQAMYDAARTYTAAGLSVAPVRLADKLPWAALLPKNSAGRRVWSPFQAHIPSDDWLRDWFIKHNACVALVCGRVSGGLELIDFDHHPPDQPQVFDPWAGLVESQAAGLVARLVVARTQHDGRHVIYRCPEIAGNQKLAQYPTAHPATDRPMRGTLIETRGRRLCPGGAIPGLHGVAGQPDRHPVHHAGRTRDPARRGALFQHDCRDNLSAAIGNERRVGWRRAAARRRLQRAHDADRNRGVADPARVDRSPPAGRRQLLAPAAQRPRVERHASIIFRVSSMSSHRMRIRSSTSAPTTHSRSMPCWSMTVTGQPRRGPWAAQGTAPRCRRGALGTALAGPPLQRHMPQRKAKMLRHPIQSRAPMQVRRPRLEVTADQDMVTPASLASEPTTAAALPQIIVTNRPLPAITAEALAALRIANAPPELFVRSGVLARVRCDKRGRPVIDDVDAGILRGRMARTGFWYRTNQNGDLRHIPPPDDVVKDLLALGAWPFPPLEALTETPALRPAGTILDRPGYDPATGLYYLPPQGFTAPAIPSHPSHAEVRAAVDLIEEAIGEFPYADAASKANTWALLLTPILRPAIRGNTPLALIDKPQAGTGASLLAELVALLATGRQAAMMTAPNNDEEWRKKITAALSEGSTVITIDNVEGVLVSAALAAALTSSTWKDRISRPEPYDPPGAARDLAGDRQQHPPRRRYAPALLLDPPERSDGTALAPPELQTPWPDRLGH